MLVSEKTAVSLTGEWLEAFWCKECDEVKWYHVFMRVNNVASGEPTRTYDVSAVAPKLWEQVVGAIDPEGNPSVGEFTRRHARMLGYNGLKDFTVFDKPQL